MRNDLNMNFGFPFEQQAIAVRTIKKYWVVVVQLNSFLTSALDRNIISFRSRPFYPRGKHHQYSFNRRMGGQPKTVVSENRIIYL